MYEQVLIPHLLANIENPLLFLRARSFPSGRWCPNISGKHQASPALLASQMKEAKPVGASPVPSNLG